MFFAALPQDFVNVLSQLLTFLHPALPPISPPPNKNPGALCHSAKVHGEILCFHLSFKLFCNSCSLGLFVMRKALCQLRREHFEHFCLRDLKKVHNYFLVCALILSGRQLSSFGLFSCQIFAQWKINISTWPFCIYQFIHVTSLTFVTNSILKINRTSGFTFYKYLQAFLSQPSTIVREKKRFAQSKSSQWWTDHPKRGLSTAQHYKSSTSPLLFQKRDSVNNSGANKRKQDKVKHVTQI